MGTPCRHLLTWPRSAGLSFRDKYETVSLVYSGLIRHLVQVEEVNISVWDAEMEAGVRNLLTKHEVPLDRVHFHHFPAYEPRCRDHGPIFLARTHHGKREQAIVDWQTMPGEPSICRTILIMPFPGKSPSFANGRCSRPALCWKGAPSKSMAAAPC